MAWLRALGFVAAVVVLAGLGGGAAATVGGPLTKENSFEGGGWPLDGSYPTGSPIRFVESSLFGIGIVFHNTSSAPVTVVGASAVLPSRSIVGQVGTRLLSWNPAPCPPNIIGCLVHSFIREASASDRPEPVTVQPGMGLAVQLDFQVGSCSALPFASFAPVTGVTLSYEGGAQQTFDLGGATIRPIRPPARVCAPRPFSRLATDGLFASSTASTIPIRTDGPCAKTSIGSFLCDKADRCARTGADVSFQSGMFQTADGAGERIEIKLYGYRGVGRYFVGRSADVTNKVEVGPEPTFHAFFGFVTVTRATSRTLQGRLHATLTGFRKRPFHAFGTWACTLGT
jgi:hypothetical protein